MEPAPNKNLTTFWLFTLTAFAISWLAWGVIFLVGQRQGGLALTLLFYLGGFGPSLAGFYWAWRTDGRAGMKRLAARALQFRFRVWYYAIILAIWPVLFIAAALLAAASGSPAPAFGSLQSLAGKPLAIIGLLLMALIYGPLSEEFGWRGFALDILDTRLGPVRGSLLLGLVWGIWQLPLFFYLGTTQSQLPIPLFLVNILFLSVIFTWVYQSTEGSLASVILLHFMFNLSYALLPLSPRGLFFLVVLQIPFVLPLVIGWLFEKRTA